tara:strand:+ start:328 stop:516 length:189 start_codon:yes stop_codon:yes gene_type:complete
MGFNEINFVEFGLFVSGILASLGAILKISQGSKCDYIKCCCLEMKRKPEINYVNEKNIIENK